MQQLIQALQASLEKEKLKVKDLKKQVMSFMCLKGGLMHLKSNLKQNTCFMTYCFRQGLPHDSQWLMSFLLCPALGMLTDYQESSVMTCNVWDASCSGDNSQ